MTATRDLRPAEVDVLEAALAPLGYVRAPRLTVRAQVIALVRRPSRTTQLEGLLDRYRWANAGLRERLAELTDERLSLLDAITVLADREARTLGHAHPAIVGLRAIVAAAQERPSSSSSRWASSPSPLDERRRRAEERKP